MKTQRIKTGFLRRPDGKLIILGQTVKDSMTDNINFPTPQPGMPAFTTGLDEFTAAVAAAKTGGAEQKTIRDQKKAAFADLMEKLAAYVEMVSDGDIAKMQSSGFELTKIAEPIGPLGPGENFQMTQAGKGALQLSVDKKDGAKVYEFQLKKAGEQDWTIKETSTRTKILVQDLERGKEYVGRVVPIGTSDVREYSAEYNAFVA